MSFRRAGSIMARHKQIAAEIDMHAEVLPALGQRLDIVIHRVGQRGKPDDPSGSAAPISASRNACARAPCFHSGSSSDSSFFLDEVKTVTFSRSMAS